MDRLSRDTLLRFNLKVLFPILLACNKLCLSLNIWNYILVDLMYHYTIYIPSLACVEVEFGHLKVLVSVLVHFLAHKA